MTWFLNVGIEPMVVKSDKDGWLESFSYVVIPTPESSWSFYTRMAQNEATADPYFMIVAIKISAVAFKEEGVWVVQGIEHDICTHAKDAAGVPAAFMRAVVENALISEHLGREPLKGIKPAFIRKGKEAAMICEGLDALERDWQRAHKVNPTP